MDAYVLAPSGRVVAQSEPPLLDDLAAADAAASAAATAAADAAAAGGVSPVSARRGLHPRWEVELAAVARALERASLRVECFSRVPYLCQGASGPAPCSRHVTPPTS